MSSIADSKYNVVSYPSEPYLVGEQGQGAFAGYSPYLLSSTKWGNHKYEQGDACLIYFPYIDIHTKGHVVLQALDSGVSQYVVCIHPDDAKKLKLGTIYLSISSIYMRPI